MININVKKIIVVLNSGKTMVASEPKFLNLGDDKKKGLNQEDLSNFLSGEVLIIESTKPDKSGVSTKSGKKEYHSIKIPDISAITFEV